MTKEIIGYELIKEYPNSKKLGTIYKYVTKKLLSDDGYTCTALNQSNFHYPEFWKPIYQEEELPNLEIGKWYVGLDEGTYIGKFNGWDKKNIGIFKDGDNTLKGRWFYNRNFFISSFPEGVEEADKDYVIELLTKAISYK